MNDKQLNGYVGRLLDWTRQERIDSKGEWAASLDFAMKEWVARYPGTRPPAFAKVKPPPSCFSGATPPIYEGELE